MKEAKFIVIGIISLVIGIVLATATLYFTAAGIHSIFCNNINGSHQTSNLCDTTITYIYFPEFFSNGIIDSKLDIQDKGYVRSMKIILIKIVSILSLLLYIALICGLAVLGIMTVFMTGVFVIGLFLCCIMSVWIIIALLSIIFSPGITIHYNGFQYT